MKNKNLSLEIASDILSLDKDRMINAINLKNSNIPNSLFKYRDINDFSLDNLENDTLWLTGADSYNDPYDSTVSWSLESQVGNLNFINSLLENKEYLNDVKFEEVIGSKDTLMKCMGSLIKKDDVSEMRKALGLMKSEIIDAYHYIRIISSKNNNIIDTAMFDDFEKKFIDLINQIYHKTFGSMDDIDELCDEICNMLFSNMLNQQLDINEKYNEVTKKEYNICSLSEVNDSILMWSHYSNNHKGFVMEYDLTQEGSIVNDLWPVVYSDHLFKSNAMLESYLRYGTINPILFVLASLYKSKEWKYEREWRIIEIDKSKSKTPYNRKVPRVKAIYLGAKISPVNERILKEIAKRKGVPIYKMELSTSEFKMTSKKI